VRVLATGAILFGPQGSLRARGGLGAGGMLYWGFAPTLGGGGGGGSGGHVVLESAERIDLRACPLVDLSSSTDMRFAIDARGGQGGRGKSGLGGAQYSSSGPQATSASLDACPPGYPSNGDNACRGHINGAGGAGGPGIVQLHTPRGEVGASPDAHDILLPTGGATLDNVCSPRPLMPSDSSPLLLLTSAGAGLGLFQLDSDDCDGDGEPDRYSIALDVQRDLDSSGVLDECEPLVSFCSGDVSSNGCSPRLTSSGAPSASAPYGFVLHLQAADQGRLGALHCALERASTPFNVGAQWCLRAPVRRVAVASTAGSPGGCQGTWSIDWNSWRAAYPTAFGSTLRAGDVVFAQAWLRDPAAAGSTVFTNALRIALGP
jgi:hypothetical protein